MYILQPNTGKYGNIKLYMVIYLHVIIPINVSCCENSKILYVLCEQRKFRPTAAKSHKVGQGLHCCILNPSVNVPTGLFAVASLSFLRHCVKLRLACGVKSSAKDIFKHFSYFSQIISIYILCKLSPKETICIKCQNLFSGKNKKKKSFCRLLKILPSMLSVDMIYNVW